MAKKTAKDTAKTFVNYVDNGFEMPQQFPIGCDLFFNNWDYLFYLSYSVYFWHTWKSETKDNISFDDHLVLVYSCVLVIVGEHIIQ